MSIEAKKSGAHCKKLIGVAVSMESRSRKVQQQVAVTIAHHVKEYNDFNMVALFLSKLASKMPVKAVALADWYGRFYPMIITSTDGQYRCKARKKHGDTYNYHLLDTSWQFAQSEESPFWVSHQAEPQEREAKGLEALRDELVKMGSDRAYNNGRIDMDYAMMCSKLADMVQQQINSKSIRLADAEETVKSQSARINELELAVAQEQAHTKALTEALNQQDADAGITLQAVANQ